jgi:hypothetical protein
MARTRTYRAAKGCTMASSPLAYARLAMMIENSPRERIVRRMFMEA